MFVEVLFFLCKPRVVDLDQEWKWCFLTCQTRLVGRGCCSVMKIFLRASHLCAHRGRMPSSLGEVCQSHKVAAAVPRTGHFWTRLRLSVTQVSSLFLHNFSLCSANSLQIMKKLSDLLCIFIDNTGANDFSKCIPLLPFSGLGNPEHDP